MQYLNNYWDALTHVFKQSSLEGFFVVIGILAISLLLSVFMQERLRMRVSSNTMNWLLGAVPLMAVLTLQVYLIMMNNNQLALTETNLQLIIFLYFLFILKNRVQLVFEGLTAVGLLIYFVNMQHPSVGRFALAVLGAIAVILISAYIQKRADSIIDHPWKYLAMILLYANAWWMMLSLLYPNITVAKYLALITKFIIFMGVIHILNIFVRRMWKHYITLQKNIGRDFLTNAYNRESFDSVFNEVFDAFSNNQIPWSLLLFDIDNFKQVNDTYGHLVGDEVLKQVTSSVQSTLIETNSSGQLFRLGGEEFGIIFRNKTEMEAVEAAEIIMQHIEEVRVPIAKDNTVLNVTVSAGVSEQKLEDAKALDLYGRVDSYLYTSKNEGKHALTTSNWTRKYN
ncbi:diguanylate cyclase [Weissella kandleri]|uniref:GGDEF domain-containing protein n=1 Tax=Weissella kandleri TaxID=1616 RepID=UPI00387E4F7F